MILQPDRPAFSPIARHTPSRCAEALMSFRRLSPLLLLSVACLAVWCIATQRTSWESWTTPLQLHGDPLEVYARVQAAKEDLTQPLRGFSSLPRLGGPAGADWGRYPISDRVVFTGLGLLARVLGVFTAVNFAIVFVHALNAVAFYLCARFLRWRTEWALATAMLFSFCSYNFRWGVTVSFSLTFFIPVLLLFCGWIARHAPAVAAKRWTWIGVGLGVWLGGANPYLSFFASQLVGGSVLLQFLRRRDFARCRAGLIFFLVLGTSFFVQQAAYFFAKTDGASRLTLSRNYAGSEIYALKPADLVVPPAEHPVTFLGQAGAAYQAQSALRTEFFVNYLGLAALIGLAILLVTGLRPVIRPQSTRIPDALLGVIWTMLFSAVGGINSLLALGGLELFRASNRNSIFILVWALFFFGRWFQRRWRTEAWLPRYGLPLAIVLLSLADTMPALHAFRQLRQNTSQLQHYRKLMTGLEEKLGRGASIFQVPTPPFPEAGTAVKMPDYEHFLPYLTSETLRFSYGALRGTALSRCLRALARVPPAMMKMELEATGFSAVWIDHRGVFDGGVSLMEGFRQLGLQEYPQSEVPDVSIFLLEPSPHPVALDLTDPRLFEPWDVVLSMHKPELFIYDGWYDLERAEDRSWRWAQSAASTGIMMPVGGKVQLSFWAYSLERGEIVLEADGHEITRIRSTPTSRDQRTVQLNLSAGRHRLVWRFTGPVVRPKAPDGRKLGFALENLTLTFVPSPDPTPSRPTGK